MKRTIALMLLMLIRCASLKCEPSLTSLASSRNPFAPAGRMHAYRCVAIGELCIVGGRTDRCAFICIDAESYSVRTGDVVAGHLVQSISETAIILIDELGCEQRIFKQKKGPST